MTLVGLLSLAFNSLTDSRSSAQDNNAAGLEIVNLTGQLEAIVGNQLKIVGEDKTANFVLIGNDSTFTYNGTADPAVLTPGLMVRFTADFDLAGKPQAPLAELEIFRPMRGRRLPLEVQQSQTPGVYPVDPQGPASAAAKRSTAKEPPANKAAPENKAAAGQQGKTTNERCRKTSRQQRSVCCRADVPSCRHVRCHPRRPLADSGRQPTADPSSFPRFENYSVVR
ncbi:MAG: hypothetical protein R3C56_00720 [Pirellulaceae bacterium]